MGSGQSIARGIQGATGGLPYGGCVEAVKSAGEAAKTRDETERTIHEIMAAGNVLDCLAGAGE